MNINISYINLMKCSIKRTLMAGAEAANSVVMAAISRVAVINGRL